MPTAPDSSRNANKYNMKARLISLLLLLTVGIIAAQAKVINYAGTVGTYKVKARLVVVEKRTPAGPYTDWSGTYTYTKGGNTLNLSGGQSAYTDWDIVLNETTPKGNNSAEWRLVESTNGTLTGWMYVYASKKKFKVVLRPVK